MVYGTLTINRFCINCVGVACLLATLSLKMVALFLVFLSIHLFTACGEVFSIYSVSLASNVSNDSPPVIGSSTAFFLTCNVTLHCSSTCSHDNLTINWLYEGEPIDSIIATSFVVSNPSPYFVMNANTVTSIIVSNETVSLAHTGVYSCVATLDSGDSSNNTFVVTVRVPSPVVSVSNATNSFNNKSSLHCTASILSSIPVTYSYTWAPLVSYDSTLSLLTNVSSAGEYRCTVTASYIGNETNPLYVIDSVSVSSYGYLVFVVTGNINVTVETNSNVLAGSRLDFMCTAVPPLGLSATDLMYSWFRPNGNALSESSINLVTVNDAGTYACSVSASHSSPFVVIQSPVGSASLTLTVRIPTPIVTANGNTATAGVSTNISCTVNLPNFNSYSTNTVIEYSYYSPQSTTPVTRSTHVFNYFMTPFTNYARVYTCSARILYQGGAAPVTNSSVNTSRATLYVKIPKPAVSLSSVLVMKGNPAVFNCLIEIPYFVSNADYNGLLISRHASPSNGGSFTSPTLVGSDLIGFNYTIDNVIESYGGEYNLTAQLGHNSAYIQTSVPDTGAGVLYVANMSIVSSTQTLLVNPEPYDRFTVNCSVAITPTPANFTISFSWPILNTSTFVSALLGSNGNIGTMTVNGLEEGKHMVNCIASITVNGSINMDAISESINIMVKGQSLPIRPLASNVHVHSNTATIYWTVPEVAYTPENYTVLYGLAVDNLTMTSSTVNMVHDDFLTATNIQYNVTINGLALNEDYYFQIVSDNILGRNYSGIGNFTTGSNNVFSTSVSSSSNAALLITPSPTTISSVMSTPIAPSSSHPLLPSSVFTVPSKSSVASSPLAFTISSVMSTPIAPSSSHPLLPSSVFTVPSKSSVASSSLAFTISSVMSTPIAPSSSQPLLLSSMFIVPSKSSVVSSSLAFSESLSILSTETPIPATPISLLYGFQNTTVNQSDTTMLSCVFAGNFLSVTWFHGDQELRDIDGKIAILKLQNLENFVTISNVTQNEEGSYTCKASNGMSTMHHTAYVTVQVPASLQPDNISRKVLFNNSVIISFTITGAAPAVKPNNIYWYFKRYGTDTFLPIPSASLSEDRLSLFIARAQTTERGMYRVSVTNEAGTTESVTVLHVIVKAELLHYVPGISHVRRRGESVSFNCTADGISLPTINWRRNGQLIVSNARRRVQLSEATEGFRSSTVPGVMQITSTLVITELSEDDNGNYSCRADNEAQIGDVTLMPYNLKVIGVPSINYCSSSPCQYYKDCHSLSDSYYCDCLEGYTGRNCEHEVMVFIRPQIKKAPEITSGRLYTSVSLTCMAVGSPNPSIGWYKDNRPIITNNSDPSILSISELDLSDRGFYHCEATNIIHGVKVSINSTAVLLNITDILQYKVVLQLTGNLNNLINRINFIEDANYYLAGSNTSISTFLLMTAIDPYYYLTLTVEVIVTILTEQTQETKKHNLGIENYMSLLNTHYIGGNLTVSSVERFDGCSSSMTILPSHSGKRDLDIIMYWPETSIGVMAVVDCPCGNINTSVGGGKLQAFRYCGGDFTSGGVWKNPEVMQCNFSDLARSICNLQNLPTEERVEELRAITSNVTGLDAIEVTASVNVLVSTTDSVSGNFSLSLSFLDVVDSILLVDRNTLEESQILSNTSGKVLEAIETVAQTLPVTNMSEPVTITQKTFAISVQQIGIDELKNNGQTVSIILKNSSGFSFIENYYQSSIGSIHLPDSLFNSIANRSTVRIANAAFLSDSLFIRRQSNDLAIGSIIISATVVGVGTIQGLIQPIQLEFEIISNNNGSSPQCSFWNQTLDDGYGQWSSKGCNTTISDGNVICYCNHLTNFAILLDVSPSIEPTVMSDLSLTLDSISYIGLIVSLVCLIITVISYAINKKLRASDHGQLLINLCCALIGLYITFIIAQHSSFSRILCIIVAALLQYFFLVVFMLMASEAVNLYLKLVIILGSEVPHFTLKATVVSWVLPLFIVSFCVAPSYENYYGYHFCRAFGFPFYIGMAAPFLIIYSFNWIIFGIILFSFIWRKISSAARKTNQQKKSTIIKKQLGISIILLVFFGLGWGIGLLATQDIHKSEVVQNTIAGLFVIITAFHGFFIFIMRCLRSREVRTTWQKLLCCAKIRKLDITLSTTHKNDNKTLNVSTIKFASHLSLDMISEKPNDKILLKENCLEVPNDPKVTESEPQGTESEPQGTESEPQGTESEPQGTESEPQGTESEPQGTESEPQGTESEPQGTESEPQGTESEPQGTESEPQETESEPQIESDSEPTTFV